MAYHLAASPAELEPLLSAERLSTYHRLAPVWGTTAMQLYLLGLELASSFHADLALAEVVLRNAMNDQLTAVYGLYWWDRGDLLVDRRSQAAVATARREARFRHGDLPGRLLAHLRLGFWVHLLERPHDARLWRPALRHAFPHSTGVRADVYATAQLVLAVRNRVAHHEPLVGGLRRPGVPCHAPPRSPHDLHHDLVALVRMISPAVGDWIAGHSRTPALLEGAPRTSAPH